jgi:glycosyltransferase involved in cell wall biosynthesis
LNRRPVRAWVSLLEAALLRRLERRWLPRFDRVWVCSRPDADSLARRVPGVHPGVAPNVVPVPCAAPEGPAAAPFRFLFIGTLGYYPNQDALLWFLREILPRMRPQTDRPFRVTVAGGGLPPALARQLRSAPEVEVLGYVEDLASLYRESGAVVVPLRAGGGSRIKIIEAFAGRGGGA